MKRLKELERQRQTLDQSSVLDQSSPVSSVTLADDTRTTSGDQDTSTATASSDALPLDQLAKRRRVQASPESTSAPSVLSYEVKYHQSNNVYFGVYHCEDDACYNRLLIVTGHVLTPPEHEYRLLTAHLQDMPSLSAYREPLIPLQHRIFTTLPSSIEQIHVRHILDDSQTFSEQLYRL